MSLDDALNAASVDGVSVGDATPLWPASVRDEQDAAELMAHEAAAQRGWGGKMVWVWIWDAVYGRDPVEDDARLYPVETMRGTGVPSPRKYSKADLAGWGKLPAQMGIRATEGRRPFVDRGGRLFEELEDLSDWERQFQDRMREAARIILKRFKKYDAVVRLDAGKGFWQRKLSDPRNRAKNWFEANPKLEAQFEVYVPAVPRQAPEWFKDRKPLFIDQYLSFEARGSERKEDDFGWLQVEAGSQGSYQQDSHMMKSYPLTKLGLLDRDMATLARELGPWLAGLEDLPTQKVRVFSQRERQRMRDDR